MLHFTLRSFRVFSLFGLGVLAVASGARAGVLVNDTWIDGTDTDPGFTGATGYAEPGTDTDGDGDIESTWFQGGAGSLNPTAANGPLRGDLTGITTSANWTTYFKPTGQKVVLAAEGDSLKITWTFKLVNVNTGNTSQGFRFGVVDSGARIAAANASPPTTTYAGYAIFGNMGQTLGNSGPFQLKERTSLAADTLLNNGDDFGTIIGDGATSGLNGYVVDTEYTMTWQMTRGASDSLDLNVSMSGGTLGNGLGSDDGKIEVVANDPSPSTFQYDTFNIRPSSEATNASEFLTSSFKAEFLPAGGEPTLNANFNGDAQVDGDDLMIWQRNVGTVGTGTLLTGDANGDFDVDADDLQVWRDHFGQPTAVGAVNPVPEPASLVGAVLAMLGAAPLVRRRRVR
jgi:hypothetical protein